MNEITSEMSPILEKAPDLAMTYGLKILLALVVFLVGKWLAGALSRGLFKAMTARNIDATVVTFVKNIAYYVFLTVVIVAALGQLGVQTASFIAVIAAAGLAIGFALQGSLANFASGVLLILFRPFKLGDYVEAGGAAGVVQEISIFSTILRTPDNKIVTITNGAVTESNIVNYSTEPKRRVDITVGVSYSSDIKLVKQTLEEIAAAEPRVLEGEDKIIKLANLGDSSVDFILRVWVETANYWPVYWDLMEQIKLVFDEKDIEIPFPQMDLHVRDMAPATK